MTAPLQTAFVAAEPAKIAEIPGRIAIFAAAEGGLEPLARRVDRLTRGAVARLVASPAFVKAKAGSGHVLAHPAGLAAEALLVVKLPKKPTPEEARLAGAAIAIFNGTVPLTVLAGGQAGVPEVALGLVLRAYAFTEYRTPEKDAPEPNRAATFQVKDPEAAEAGFAPLAAQAAGVYFTRDLVSEPANVLTTTEFAERLTGLRELGVEVEVLEEPQLEELGMRTLLGVGQGSASPSKVVVMQWRGGAEAGQAGRADRQGRGLRHRRHLDQAGRRHGGDDDGHGRRRGRRRGDEDAGAAQGAGQRRRAWSGWSRTCPTARRSGRATWCAR